MIKFEIENSDHDKIITFDLTNLKVGELYTSLGFINGSFHSIEEEKKQKKLIPIRNEEKVQFGDNLIYLGSFENKNEKIVSYRTKSKAKSSKAPTFDFSKPRYQNYLLFINKGIKIGMRTSSSMLLVKASNFNKEKIKQLISFWWKEILDRKSEKLDNLKPRFPDRHLEELCFKLTTIENSL